MKATKRVAQLVGSGGFSAANRWDSGADVEPKGSALMSRIVVFSPVRQLTVGAAADPVIFHKRSGADGWKLEWNRAGQYRFIIDDGGSTPRTTVLAPSSIPQKGECIVWCNSYNETSLLVYAKGESNSGGPWVGYSIGNKDVEIGSKGGSDPASDFSVLACLATDTYALSVEQMSLAEAAFKTMLEQGQRIDPAKLPGSGWNWIWDARDCHKVKKGEWADQESGVILAETGETQLHAIEPRFG